MRLVRGRCLASGAFFLSGQEVGMYICYLDESGTPEAGSSTDHFVLLGLAVPAETWKDKDSQISALKAKYGLEDREIHTAWMLRDYQEQHRVPDFESLGWEPRRKATLGVRAMNLARPRTNSQQRTLLKNYRKSEDYVHLTRLERLSLVRELADVVGSWNDVRIFAEAQSKAHIGGGANFEFAFEQVVTRFNTFLTLTGGPIGLLVQDNNQTVAQKLTTTMRRFHQQGTAWAKIGRIIETPLFVDSALTSMVQLADLCAFATRRYFEKAESDLFDRIKPCIDRKVDGSLVGIRHFTGRYACQCDVCREHGRYTLGQPPTAASA
jgi:hypothetical protein